MADLLKEGTKYITVACKEQQQRELLRYGFQKSNVPMNDDTYKPISVSFKNTQSVFEELKAALEE